MNTHIDSGEFNASVVCGNTEKTYSELQWLGMEVWI